MGNKTLTSVEWLISKLTEKPIEDINDEYWFGIIGQAKELEKQQHEETWYDSTLQFDNAAQMTNKKLFEDYYNDTYGEQA